MILIEVSYHWIFIDIFLFSLVCDIQRLVFVFEVSCPLDLNELSLDYLLL